MTREDTIKLLSVLRTAYPQFYRGISKDEAYNTISLWSKMFQNENTDIVNSAVLSFIECDSSGFPPTVGQIKEKCRLIKGTSRATKTPMQAWDEVVRAIPKALYEIDKAWSMLSPLTQKAIGSKAVLKEWEALPIAQFETVVASNFRKSYEILMNEEEEYAKLPENVKVLVDSLRATMETKQLDSAVKRIDGTV